MERARAQFMRRMSKRWLAYARDQADAVFPSTSSNGDGAGDQIDLGLLSENERSRQHRSRKRRAPASQSWRAATASFRPYPGASSGGQHHPAAARDAHNSEPQRAAFAAIDSGAAARVGAARIAHDENGGVRSSAVRGLQPLPAAPRGDDSTSTAGNTVVPVFVDDGEPAAPRLFAMDGDARNGVDTNRLRLQTVAEGRAENSGACGLSALGVVCCLPHRSWPVVCLQLAFKGLCLSWPMLGEPPRIVPLHFQVRGLRFRSHLLPALCSLTPKTNSPLGLSVAMTLPAMPCLTASTAARLA